MKGPKSFKVVSVFLWTLFTASQGSWADELSELKGRFEKLQKEMMALQERIGKLEAEKVTAQTDSWFPGKKGDKIRIGGTFEFEYADGQDATAPEGTSIGDGQFQIDKLQLNLDAKITEDLKFKSEVKFDGDGDDISIRDTYLELVNLPWDSFVQVGNKTVFFRPDRITESYPIGGTAFWRKRDLGIWTGGSKEPLYWHFSVTNGLELNDKDFMEMADAGTGTDLLEIIGDDKRNDDLNQSKELGFGLGFKNDFDRWGEIDLLGLITRGRLAGEDVSFLTNTSSTHGAIPGYASTRRTKERYGVNIDYHWEDFNFFAEFIRAFDGKLRRNAWYVQPSYLHGMNRKYLKGLQPLFRYGQYTINVAHSPTAGLTWARQEYVPALIAHIRENLLWKWEYHFNREDTGDDQIRNDEWLTQLQYKF